jgi:hypothetical protein
MLITIKSAKAAQRPLAGFGMGAYFCDGVLVGSALVGVAFPGVVAAKGIETAAPLALPRVKWAVPAISEGCVPAGASGPGYQASIPAKAEKFAAQKFAAQKFQAQHFDHLTRVNPVLPGGVGPHPVREPEPV